MEFEGLLKSKRTYLPLHLSHERWLTKNKIGFEIFLETLSNVSNNSNHELKIFGFFVSIFFQFWRLLVVKTLIWVLKFFIPWIQFQKQSFDQNQLFIRLCFWFEETDKDELIGTLAPCFCNVPYRLVNMCSCVPRLHTLLVDNTYLCL